MCGIHGYFGFDNQSVPAEQLHGLMGGITVHRGPDDHGYFAKENMFLGMRRLSIIDVSGGHQPIHNSDRTLTIVCNGEIYNYRELRQKLLARGHKFATNSDTEVALHAYAEYGEDFVHHISGMFGLALWDARSQKLIIARDRLGIKPLYVFRDNKRLVFASEAKAILAVPEVHTDLCFDGLAHYLNLGYVPAPYSILKGIEKLMPGTMMICSQKGIETKRFWTPTSSENSGLSEDEWAELTLSEIEGSVRAQMVSDVPLGAFLSGGIDSSAVVAMMAKHSSHPVKTYSIGFGDASGGSYYNELPYARKVSELFGTQHKEIVVEPDASSLLPRLLWHLDEPIADAAFITTYLVSEFAREDVTVILSGVGGDELFGGYRRYLGEYYGRYYRRLPGWLQKYVAEPIARRLPSDRHSKLLNYSRLARSFVLSQAQSPSERYLSYVQVFSEEERAVLMARCPNQLKNVVCAALESLTTDDYLNRLMSADIQTQLPDDLLMLTDKMSMATSLECRVPLLDDRLVDLALTMPSQHKIKGKVLKSVLKKALVGVLPEEILHRQKRGFGAPFGAWLKKELRPLVDQTLSRDSIESRGLFDWQIVQETLNRHNSNMADHTDHLMSLINLELWCRMYLDSRSHEDVMLELQSA